MPDRPTYADETVDPRADIFTKVQALLIGREQRKAYQTEVDAAARSCS